MKRLLDFCCREISINADEILLVTYKPTGAVVFAGMSVLIEEPYNWQFWVCINMEFNYSFHIQDMDRMFTSRQFNLPYDSHFEVSTAKATGKEEPLDFFVPTLQTFNYLLPFIRCNGSM